MQEYQVHIQKKVSRQVEITADWLPFTRHYFIHFSICDEFKENLRFHSISKKELLVFFIGTELESDVVLAHGHLSLHWNGAILPYIIILKSTIK